MLPDQTINMSPTHHSLLCPAIKGSSHNDLMALGVMATYVGITTLKQLTQIIIIRRDGDDHGISVPTIVRITHEDSVSLYLKSWLYIKRK